MLCVQTMHEWFAEKRGNEVNLFGVFDEGQGEKDTQHNFLYGEGTKNGSILVAPMLDYYLETISPQICSA